MNVCSLAAPAPLSLLTFLSLPVFGQNPTPAHDPRIGQIIASLEQVRTIQQTGLSPDARFIAWSVSGPDGGIEVATLADSDHPHHITACKGSEKGRESGFAWSPDSKTLAFLSDCTPDHKTAIFIAQAGSDAAPRLLSQLNGYAKELQWSPDGKFLAFLYVEGATRPSGALAAMKPPSGVIGVEGLEVQRIAAADVASGAITQMSLPNLHVYEFDWSPDSHKLVYVAAAPPGENNWWVAKLYTQVMPIRAITKGGQVQWEHVVASQPQILVDPSSTKGPVSGLQIAVPRWSPDASKIAFIAGLMSDQGATGGDICVVPAAGGEAANLTAGRRETATWIAWDTAPLINYSAIEAGSSQFRTIALDSSSGNTAKGNALNFRFPATLGDGRLEGSISIARGHFAYIKSSYSEAPEVWYARDVAAECTDEVNNGCYEFRQITHYNDGLKPSWGKSESVTWTNDGFNVRGWLLYPANYDAAKKYPLVVYVHGGPSSASLPRWPYAGYGPAPFSALGYFVLMPNPRGSYGEGEKFTQANRKDFGYGDLHDILAGVDTVARKFQIDPERVGITGWSYGGFMTMFAVTQTTRFRAAVAGAGISNWQSYYGENSIDQWMIPFFGASVYDDPAVYAKSSAINFIKRVKTPTLVVVGDRDGECPAPQSFEFWHALRDEHVPTQLVVYPNEGHGFVDPAHRRDVLERALAWFQEYMP